MKIFTDRGKVNFVDENNVVLGYDSEQQCCEFADWFISNQTRSEIPDGYNTQRQTDYTGWVFDVDFFWEQKRQDVFDGGGIVAFRITKGSEELFVHLFNCHNGYYSHGFEISKTIRSGHL